MELRPYQRTAVDFLKSRTRGFVHAPAGSGKTVIGAAALAESVKDGDSVVWLANTKEQVQQALAALASVQVDKDVNIDVCCVASQPDTSKATFIVIDEGHHSPARTWTALIPAGSETRVWGLSATPWSGDPDRDAVLRGTFREFHVIHREELVSQGHLEEGKALIWDLDSEDEYEEQIEEKVGPALRVAARRFNYLLARAESARQYGNQEAAEAFEEQYKEKVEEQKRYVAWRFTQEVLRNNTARNDWACAQAIEEMANGQSVLVLVNAIEHGEELSSRIPGSTLVYSRIGLAKRRKRIEGFRKGEIQCLVATSLADEGLDVPVASRLILVAGGRSAGKLEQRAGRVLRPYHGKQGGIIHDFLDRGARLANAQAWARIRTYEALGYEPQIVTP